MQTLNHLFDNNRKWARRIRERDPEFFLNLARKQSPAYLWIGCSDSRVPANQIVDLGPGELFVHRNVANLVVHTDLNCLSAIQFAVEMLKVRHIIVCGHYGCGGVGAAFRRDRLGLTDKWVCHIEDVRMKHDRLLARIGGDTEACNRLCELNVIEQVANVCCTGIARDAWRNGQELSVHGWIYDIGTGLLRDLNFTVSSDQQTMDAYEAAVTALSTETG